MRSEQYISLLYTIHKFGSIPGKKALHKILYFVSVNNDLFSYEWNKFGPYSEELKYVLDDAVLDGMITITPVNLPRKEGQQFNMKLSRGANQTIMAQKIDNDLTKKIEYVYNFLNTLNPRQMELLASIHYIIEKFRIDDANSIFDAITRLKPKSGFTLEDIIWAKNVLQKQTSINN